jgi:hypothetical protein
MYVRLWIWRDMEILTPQHYDLPFWALNTIHTLPAQESGLVYSI